MAQQAIVTPRPTGTPRPTATPRPGPAPRPRKRANAAVPIAPTAPAKTRPPTPAQAKRTATRQAKQVKDTAATQARQVKGTAVDQTKVVAQTATTDVRQLAGTVRTQADQVKGELTGQARELLAETQGQLRQQADVQASRVANALFQVGTQAVALSQGRPEQAGPLVDYAEQAANWLDNCASHIEDRGLDGLATDVVDFARRRPGVFLAGAAVVGFGVGRLIRSGAVSADGNGHGVAELEA